MSAAAIKASNLVQKQYSQDQINPENESMVPTLRKIAQLFAEVFADPPWEEYKVCPNKHYAPKSDADLTECSKCNEPLELAYPEDQVMQNIYREAGHNNGARLTIFENDHGTPYAFGWGFACSGDELATIFHSPAMKEKGLEVVDEYMKDKSIFYISELLVAPDARGQGIATKITNSLVERARELDLNIVLYTHYESPMAQIAEKIEMLPILQRGEDLENPGRVYYARAL